jgi:hypothetical protein
MTTTSITLNRRRRIAAALLALPLSLAMTGSALATGSTVAGSTSGTATAPARAAALVAPAATGGSPSEGAAAHAAAAGAAADKAAAAQAAADRAAADKAATQAAQAVAAATAPQRSAPGAAAGSAAGTSAVTRGTAVNASTTSSKAQRPTPPVPATPPQPRRTADRNGTGANPGDVADGKAAGQPCTDCRAVVPTTPRTVPPVTCPGTGTPAPGGDRDNCPTKPKTCPDGSTLPSSGDVQDCDLGNRNGGKITICHATGSSTNPYVVITIDRNGLNGHGDHAGDIIPAPAGGCPVGGTTPDQPGTGGGKITICHATGSSTNPYVVITIDLNGLNGHGDHAGDIIPAPAGGCPSAPPVCPTVLPATGPVQAGCEPQVPPTQGGGGTVPPTGNIPIGTVTPGQPAVNPPGQNPPPIGTVTPGQPAVNPPLGMPPIGTVTPGQPAANPVPVGPPTGIRPNGSQPRLISGLPTAAAQRRAVPSALPFTGTDATLLAELGALLLLAGGGIAVAARRERAARAA